MCKRTVETAVLMASERVRVEWWKRVPSVQKLVQCAFSVSSKQSCHLDFIEKVHTCLVVNAFTELSPENRDGWLPSLGIPEQNKEREFKQIVFQ
jgi:hypothetical protein